MNVNGIPSKQEFVKSMRKEKGEIDPTASAFPIPGQDMQSLGLTKLEWFAGKALTPLVENQTKGHSSYGNEIEIARRAFDIAEAMLKESEKRHDA
jgi:hypothetical protein